ncbi:hypothetical protein K440DRAFT_99582 [Wilcoxina mikolae CBS 423.85]|nr:hypothetical protein K440DRAFT_99582 [Wilcoxina mikolae CBS 423.85]
MLLYESLAGSTEITARYVHFRNFALCPTVILNIIQAFHFCCQHFLARINRFPAHLKRGTPRSPKIAPGTMYSRVPAPQKPFSASTGSKFRFASTFPVFLPTHATR